MKCEHCKIVFETNSEYRPAVCPFCGRPVRAQNKPSFHETWAQIKADPLLRSRNKVRISDLQDVLHEYAEAMQEDCEAFYGAEQFLKNLAETNRLPAGLIQPEHVLCKTAELLKDEDDEQILSFRLNKAMSTPALLQNTLERVMHKEADKDKKQAAAAELRKQAQSLTQDLNLFPGLQSCQSRQERIKSWTRALTGEDTGSFTLMDADWMSEILQMSMDTEGRVHDFEALMNEEKPDVDAILSQFFRPLKDIDHAFDHQALLAEKMAGWCMNHQEEFTNACTRLIDGKTVLRGMHLGLGLLKNTNEELQVVIDPLLEKHYIVMYRKPYEWMESTDWKVLSKAE